ncbi:TetR/AcrR family transcriptional regulator [Nocardia sp. NPDC058058]|uniref:TetR/AcrR family transcriptional regulator n=1 Tax=Nocardia sp. NPDC058058 TaxID=3346317 RepID=UPI0036DE6598
MDLPIDVRKRRKQSHRRRWTEHNSTRQTLILEAAVELIEEHDSGAEISIQQIAERAGLARSVLYRQFDNREDLDARIREFIQLRAIEQFETAMVLDHGKTVGETLLDIMRTVVGWAAEHPNLYRFEQSGRLHGYASPQSGAVVGRQRLAELVWQRFSTVTAVLGIDVRPFHPLAHGVIGLVEGVVNQYIIAPSDSGDSGYSGPVDPEAIAELLATSVWHLFSGHAADKGYRFDRDANTAALLGGLLGTAADGKRPPTEESGR